MKNFKLFLIIGLFTFSLQTQAQIKFGVKAGLNANNIAQNYKDSENEDATKMTIGYNIGLSAIYSLSDALSLQSGLSLSTKGYAFDLKDGLESGESVDGYSRISTTYIEIPVHFTYTINEQFSVYAGPYAAFGIGGKWKIDATYSYDGGESDSQKGEIKLKPQFGEMSDSDYDALAEDEEPYNGLDFGLNFGVGYKVNEQILVNLGYSLGLGNQLVKFEGNDNYGDNKLSNRVITLSVSYFFGE